MCRRFLLRRAAMLLPLALLAIASAIPLQSSAQTVAPSFASLAPTAFDASGPVLRAPAQPEKPFTVAGERGVLLGQQDGTFEAWVLPVKLLSHLTIEATIEGYTVPIHVNQQAASIEVRPDRTILTYSHIGFTLRQIMFSPDKAPGGTGPIALFEFDCLHSTDFTFRFIPNLEWMWPERNEGVPGIEWVPSDPHAASSPGFYVLHSDYPDLAGALTIPGAQPGILAPYQERPQDHPVELKLHIDPARDNGRLFPLLMAAGMNSNSATNAALGATLAQLNASIPSLYATHSASYRKFLENAVTIDTPDKSLNQAFQWAEISIEQLKAHPVDAHDTPTDETALVAGYYASGDSARPGFGWFFGRDSLYTLYAINGYGDFALTRSELEFLIHRQRADGKIMHEYSQTAAAIDWQAFPYEYAAADSTPLFLLAFADYLRASGDTAFIAAHRDAIEKAWAFETDPAHDTDHDGIYDNSQGTGWVESWPGGMPHQEIYLALLDQQASSAMAYIETALKDSSKADIAAQRATAIAKTINAEYYDPRKGCYAFATNPSGSPNSPVDRTTTVYPALAWWDPQSNKSLLDHGDECLRQLASADLNTDWGLRDVSNKEKIYDGTSYHQGSVWPLFTGWAALAEYRGNQPLTGYQMLKENANLTWAQDLGADTELLSGDFFVPFGRSTSHQLWSSAMVITPTLRGLFGISIDAATRTITVNPHLPAGWDHAEIRNLHIGNETVDLKFVQTKTGTLVWQNSSSQAGIHLRSDDTRATVRPDQELSFSRHPVEIAPVLEEPLPGNRTQAARVVAEEYGEHNLTVTIEGIAGSEVQLPVILSSSEVKLHIAGGELAVAPNDPAIVVHFPSGAGFQTLTVTLTW